MVTPTFSVGVLIWYFRVILGPRGIDKQQSRFIYAVIKTPMNRNKRSYCLQEEFQQ